MAKTFKEIHDLAANEARDDAKTQTSLAKDSELEKKLF
jgi:hypothetical protein